MVQGAALRESRLPEEIVASIVAERLRGRTPGEIFMGRIEAIRREFPDFGPLSQAAYRRDTAYEPV